MTPTATAYAVGYGSGPDTSLPVAAMDGEGGFVVVWSRFDRHGSEGNIVGQRFDSLGDRLGVELAINTQTAGHQNWSSLAMATNGDFVVVWGSAQQGGAGHDVFGQRFDAGGRRAGDEFRVSQHTEGDQREPERDDGRRRWFLRGLGRQPGIG